MIDLNTFRNLLELIIQTLSFKVKLVGAQVAESIEKAQIAEVIKFADSINININLEANDEVKSTAIITSRTRRSELAITESPIAFLSSGDYQSPYTLATQNIPFSSGSHLIINQPSWWETPEPVVLGRLKLTPIRLGILSTISVIERKNPRTFDIEFIDEDRLTANIWSGKMVKEIDCSNAFPQKLSAENSHWIFEKYSPSQIMKFNKLPEILLSFDENIIREAILIIREHEIRETEYYVLIVRM